MKHYIILVVLTAFTWSAARGQLPQQPVFEVASIKPAIPQNTGLAGGPRAAGALPASSQSDRSLVRYAGVTLRDLLTRAYELRSYQIVGPSWLGSERYDVNAKVPEDTTREQIPLMLQALLLERFRMSVHWENKESQVYALVVSKSGPKLTKSQPNTKKSLLFGFTGHLELKGSTLADFASAMTLAMDRPIVDMTGIEGTYDIVVDASPDSLTGDFYRGTAADPTAASPNASSIFTAVRDLGLSLEARKAPIKHLVVDKAERVPIPN
jgi:uncharacterized protein (TIGR03435 family)